MYDRTGVTYRCWYSFWPYGWLHCGDGNGFDPFGSCHILAVCSSSPSPSGGRGRAWWLVYVDWHHLYVVLDFVCFCLCVCLVAWAPYVTTLLSACQIAVDDLPFLTPNSSPRMSTQLNHGALTPKRVSILINVLINGSITETEKLIHLFCIGWLQWHQQHFNKSDSFKRNMLFW